MDEKKKIARATGLEICLAKNGGDFRGSIWLGAFVGFVITLFLSSLFPGIGHLIGGSIGGLAAGIIARGGMLNGAIAGFLAGIFGGIIIAILAIVGLAAVGGVTGGILSGLLGGLIGLAVGVIAIILAILSDGIHDWRTRRRIAGKIAAFPFFTCSRNAMSTSQFRKQGTLSLHFYGVLNLLLEHHSHIAIYQS